MQNEEIEQFELFPDYEKKIRYNNGLIKRADPNPGKKKLNWIPSEEFLRELLEESQGNIKAVADALAYPDGRPVSYQTVYKWIRKYNLEIFQDLCKVNVASSTLSKLYKKAISGEGDVRACEFILKRWGRFIGFTEDKNETEDKGELEVFAQEIRNHSEISRAEESSESSMETIESLPYQGQAGEQNPF